jgi:hypothetical protein
MLSRHFGVYATTLKKIFVHDLDLKKFTLRWEPQTLSDPQKVTRDEASNALLQTLSDLELILLMELQQVTSHGFITSMSRRPCLRNRQVTSS